jgi:hypothetical protein
MASNRSPRTDQATEGTQSESKLQGRFPHGADDMQGSIVGVEF